MLLNGYLPFYLQNKVIVYFTYQHVGADFQSSPRQPWLREATQKHCLIFICRSGASGEIWG